MKLNLNLILILILQPIKQGGNLSGDVSEHAVIL
jgi:hypothetical protein